MSFITWLLSALLGKSSRCIAQNIERLETRTLLSVAVNSSGWTVITPGAGDKVIYCSSSTGNDGNNGLSAAKPVKTLARAESLLTNHTGDQLLLKAGDTWQGDFIYWRLSGKSAQEPMVLGSYGSGPRPTIDSGSETAFETGAVSTPEVDYLAIMGIHFDANSRDPALTSKPVRNDPTGIDILSKGTDILVENCLVENYAVNMNFQGYYGTISGVTVRRNVVLDAWSSDGHAQGLYANEVNGLTLYGNYFEHNGWSAKVSGAAPTWQNHDAYLSAANTNCQVIDNIFADASAYGLQARSGGIVTGNVFINDPVGMSFGVVNGAATTNGGVTGSVTDNVFIGGASLLGVPQGDGIIVGNIKAGSGATISGNIFTQSISGSAAAIVLTYGTDQSNPQGSVGINDLKIQNNTFYDWTIGIDVEAGQSPGGKGIAALNRVTISGNQFENLSTTAIENHSGSYASQETISANSYYNANTFMQGFTEVKAVGTVSSKPMAFPDPTRSIGSYATSIKVSGGSGGLLAKADGQSEQTWNAGYDAAAIVSYIGGGFSASSDKTVSPPTTTSVSTQSPTPVTAPAASSQSALGTIQALSLNSQKGGLKFDNFKGLGYAVNGDWAEYSKVDFGSGVTKFAAEIAAPAGLNGSLQLRLDSPTGTLIGTLKAASTGSWSNYESESTTVSGATGIHNLYLVFVGGSQVANVESFQFSSAGQSATSTISALDFNSQKGGLQFDNFNGLGYANGGDWAEYNQINFGAGVTTFSANLSALAGQAGSIQIRLDSPTGTLIGTLKATPTGSWSNYTQQTTKVTGASGVHNLYLVFVGGKGVANVESFRFS
ncbi:MAG TPA: carbohydrate-binding protein [Tepidisphaeraceae bacterium]|jgi:hypothetical protein|nr:carbohydrate-binding protein [Tepidisphaeraceae bacterium]